MRKAISRVRWRRLAAAASGGALFLGGCDPQTRTAVENGIIEVSAGLLEAFMLALVQLAGEQSTTTTQVLTDSIILFCA